MKTWFKLLLHVGAAWLTAGAVMAQDIGAVASGNWLTSSIWTGGTVPGQDNNVYIGSTYPTGAAASATVTISGSDELVNNLYLGYGSGTNGALDLSNGYKVYVSNTLSIGQGATAGSSGGTGTISETTGGFFQTTNLEIHSGNTLTFGANDVATNVEVDTGSTLNLGASAKFTGEVEVENSGSVLNLNGNNLSAQYVFLGYNNGQPGSAVTLDRGTGGTITANLLQVGNGTSFNLVAGDNVTGLALFQSTTSTLGSGASVTGLTISSGSTATTTDSGNVTSGVGIAAGGVLNMGAALDISGQLTASGTGSTIQMNGNAINAYAIELGIPPGPGSPDGLPAATLDRGGAGGVLNVTALGISNGTLNLVAGDTIQVLEALSNATVTTAATGNIPVGLYVGGGSTVNLGADLNLTVTASPLAAAGEINVQDSGSALNAQGHAITADSFLVGQNGTSAVTVTNLGLVTVNTLEVGNGSALTLHGGDTVGQATLGNGQISLTGDSVLTVQQVNGTGLTLNGTSLSSLTVDPSSMDLVFNLSTSPNWDFRWQDPAAGGNWVSALESMIASGQIQIAAPDGYSVVDQGGYTYIMGGVASVPEPSSLALAGIAAACVVAGMKRHQRTGR